VCSRDRRQASVIDEVPLGLMSRMLMALVEVPVTEGSSPMVERQAEVRQGKEDKRAPR